MIYLDIEGESHIMAQEFETRMIVKMMDIAFRSSKEIVDAKNFVILLKQSIDEMRSNEAGSSRNKHALSTIIESSQDAILSTEFDLRI